jgi:Zn-dependent peptidase ImmA (M78 family)
MTADDVASAVQTSVDPHVLAEQNQEVEFEDLKDLAKLFKRPWSYLLCDEEERFPDLGQDNRTFANQRVPVSVDLIAEFEASGLILEAAVELFPNETYEVPPVRLTRDVATSRTADAIRSFLAVSNVQQLAAKDEYAALRLWVDALHRRGVYVSQRRLRDKTIRAFSTVRDGQAIIVVDTGDTPYARIFSILHEYCHIVLRSTGICDLDEHSETERYCNQVAATVLLPDALLAGELADLVFGATPDADDDRLIRLSHRLRVSQAALLIRLRDRGSISQEMYDALEERRRSRRKKNKKGPGGDYYAAAINRVGRRFARNVFGAMSDGLLDRQDAGALLGVGEHSIDRYRDALFEGGSGAT